MILQVTLTRSYAATYTVDTAAHPVQTAGWELLSDDDLKEAARPYAFQLVQAGDWKEVDRAFSQLKVLSR